MTWNNILSEIKRSLKEKSSGGHWEDADLLRRANIGQRRIVRLTGCLEETNTAATVVGQSEYSKPTKCLRVERVYYKSSENVLYPLTKNDLDLAASLGKISSPWTDNQDEPTNYYEKLRNIYLYPKPDAVDVLGMEFLVRPDDLADSDDVPFNEEPFMEDYHDLLVSFVLWRCMLEDKDALYGEYKREFYEGIASIKMDLKKPSQLQTFSLVRTRRGSGKNPLPFMN